MGMLLVLFLLLYKKFSGDHKMRMFLLSLLSVVILAGVSTRGDSIGSDTNGPWRTESRTNMIFRGSSREVVETVVTNRITQQEYHWRTMAVVALDFARSRWGRRAPRTRAVAAE